MKDSGSRVTDLVTLFAVLLAIVFAAALLVGRQPKHMHYLGDMISSPAHAHEHQAGETPEQARVIEFYRTWHRPKGSFSIIHRQSICCYANGLNQDCFPVKATRRGADGVLEIMLDTTGTSGDFAGSAYKDTWFKLNTGVEEDKQPDPRESPDGRSHACVVGQVVVCYVPGWGN